MKVEEKCDKRRKRKKERKEEDISKRPKERLFKLQRRGRKEERN